MGEHYFLNIILHWTLDQFLLIENVLFVFLIASGIGPSEIEKDP